MSEPKIPAALVQHIAHGLIERSVSIKILPALMREISPAPLSPDAFMQAGLSSPLSQWVLDDGASQPSMFNRLKSVFSKSPERTTWAQLTADELTQTPAQLVFAPLVLDTAPDVLANFVHLPKWFAKDGVLLFATLAAGGLPELVNAQPEWLELLTHWPNIMDAGARLQELRFGLPVLDVESVPLAYADFATLWHDVCAMLPALREMTGNEQDKWRDKLQQLYNDGLREINVEVLYGQVWQIQAPKTHSGEYTISLDSLTSQLEHRKTFL